MSSTLPVSHVPVLHCRDISVLRKEHRGSELMALLKETPSCKAELKAPTDLEANHTLIHLMQIKASLSGLQVSNCAINIS